MTSPFIVGQPIAYGKRFLRSIGASATDELWRRRGRIVAVAGNCHPSYTHWKTGALQPLPPEFVLVTWNNEPGEIALIRHDAICRIGGYAYAEDDGGIPFRG